MPRKQSLGVLIMATGVLLLPLATPAYAEPISATGAVGTTSQIDQTEATDQAWMLEHTGIQTADYQSAWTSVADQVGELVPGDYAGAMIREGQYVIGFMGAMPPEAAKLLSEFPADYVAMTNLGFSLQDVAALSESIVESVQHNAPGASLEIVPGALSSQITVSVDPSTVPDIDTAAVSIPSRTSTDQRIANVSVDVSSATLTAQDSQRLQALASVLALPNNGTLQVTITARTEEMPAPVVSIVGGGSLSNCTAGFTAISSSGVLGVLTAGHCGQSEIYANATGLTYLGSTFGTNGDFAFFRTIPSNNDTVTKTFRASSATDLRTQTASKDPLVGDTL